MTRVPIACTLTADEAGDRIGEWREFLARSVEERQIEGTVARLRLGWLRMEVPVDAIAILEDLAALGTE